MKRGKPLKCYLIIHVAGKKRKKMGKLERDQARKRWKSKMPFKYTCSRQKGERAKESWRESKSEKEGKIKRKKIHIYF